jgi:transposase
MYLHRLGHPQKTISYCVKDQSRADLRQGHDPGRTSRSRPLDQWSAATLDRGDGSDHVHRLDLRLSGAARASEGGTSVMLRAIAAAKEKNDRIDASKLADCLRCDFLPECYMASSEIRERRRTLRYRNLLVRQTVQCKNKIAQMLIEAGVSYTKKKLHHRGYFHQLLANNTER